MFWQQKIKMVKWLDNKDETKVAISSRIRLARNLINYPFPNKMKKEEAKEIITKVKNSLDEKFDFIKQDMKDIEKVQKGILVEKHLISIDLTTKEEASAFISEDEKMSIMVNEEDHLRIQSLMSGVDLEKAYKKANEIDDFLEAHLDYAFDERLGYLTSCPTNVGTGIRASSMLHLPALVELGYIDGVLKAANQLGLVVRGIYGEGSGYKANIFQISNQITLGPKEEDLIGSIQAMSKQIIIKELEAREFLKKKLGYSLKDRVYRSLGILKYAQVIDLNEAMNLLSNLKLGVEMEMIKGLKTREIDQIMIMIQPAYQFSFNQTSNPREKDLYRAEFIRKYLQNLVL